MTVGYEEAVIIISLAMFGLYAIIEELWHINRYSQDVASVTILLIVRNMEEEIERLIRTICEEHIRGEREIVIADIASTDRTRALLVRLADEAENIRIIHSDTARQAVIDAMAIARGDFIQICDLVHRVDAQECIDYLAESAKVE